MRYIGPIDGHDIESMESTLKSAALWDGPILVHVLTTKGLGYEPAIDDDMKMHDYKLPPRHDDEDVAAAVVLPGLLRLAWSRSRAPTTASSRSPRRWPGRRDCSNFQEQFPDRFLDVGIAEQHAVTAAAGMAMGGLKPVVAIYSTFFSRAFDQAHLDVGLLEPAGRLRLRPRRHHRRRRPEPPRTPRHRALPGDSQHDGLRALDGRGGAGHARHGAVDVDARPRCDSRRPCPKPFDGKVGDGLEARQVRRGDGSLCVLAVGKMAPAAYKALELMGDDASKVTLYDVRVLPPDAAMIDDALAHERVVSVEDGTRHGGAGTLMVSALRSRAQDLARPFPDDANPRHAARVPRTTPAGQAAGRAGTRPGGTGGRVHATARRPARVRAACCRSRRVRTTRSPSRRGAAPIH